MGTDGYVLGLAGSPNRDGRTFQMVSTALEAAATMGARVELVQMADHVVAPCRDCQPWTCMTEMRCQYSDPAFEHLSDKLLNCGALVLGTPIYWWDTSAMVKYLILKMFRVYARSAPLAGLPALGIGVPVARATVWSLGFGRSITSSRCSRCAPWIPSLLPGSAGNRRSSKLGSRESSSHQW